MCTISWFYHEHGYELFFNRDESRERPKADIPRIHNGSVRSIMPIDPQGGGTWLGVNEYGISCALLNFYQGVLPKGALRSRGQIVSSLMACKDVDSVANAIGALELSRHAPFSLLVFPPDGDNVGSIMWQWTGRSLDRVQQISPLISSAYDFSSVRESRHSMYQEVTPTALGEVKQLRFNSAEQLVDRCIEIHAELHRSHRPSKSAYSICMHRDDAETMSFSHISVGQSRVLFRYADGAPCSTPLLEAAVLDLKC